MKKARRKVKKAKIKKQKKVRNYLRDVNYHCAQLTTALRDLADRLDDVRSFHLDDKESPS